MSELNEPATTSRRNPLIWIVLVVVGLILFVFLSGDRGDLPETIIIETNPETLAVESEDQVVTVAAEPEIADDGIIQRGSNDDNAVDVTAGTIDRSLLVPPGMRARQYIEQLRDLGKPYPLSQVFDKAQMYRDEGSLADAHLLYFFAARESHLPSMMIMGELSDPVRFRAEDSLLDQADPIQSWKWYQKAADLGEPVATQRLDELAEWARNANATGDTQARQLLLNIR